MLKKLLVILIIFFSFECVDALDFCTASKEYIEYEALSEEEKEKYIEPIYCNEIIELGTSNYSVTGTNLINLFPSLTTNNSNSAYYNSVDLGYVNKADNQLGTGMCWGFSAMSAVETNAAVNNAGKFNFSEAHLGYSLLAGAYSNNDGKNGRYNADALNGGPITYAPTYFFNGYGQVLEEDMPFQSNLRSDRKDLKKIAATDYTYGTNLITVETYNIFNIAGSGICTTNDISIIKEKVAKYGAVQATMFMNEELLDASENYYISTTANSHAPNHGVLIVGWDDTISKTNFEGATRDGAWIVQNSWGSTWSNDGLFYISYDDQFICKLLASYSGVSTKTFDYNYKSADVVGTFDLYFNKTSYYATKFTKQSNSQESLDRISFPISQSSSYKIYLSRDNSLNKETWELLASDDSNEYGITSINLTDIYLDSDFTIILETTPQDGVSTSLLTTCTRNSDLSHLDISSNTNFMSDDGKNWTDMYSVGCEPDIYAYTSKVDDNVELEINSLNNFNDIISLKISRANVNTNNITYTIMDSLDNDVTNHFNIVPDYKSNEIYIVSDNTISGTFTFNINYDSISTSKTFKLLENLSSVSNKLKINSNIITVVIDRNQTFTYQDLIDSLDIENTSIMVNNAAGNNITDINSVVGTNSTVITNNNSYKIVVIGDVSGDGTINSADLMKIVKYLKGSTMSLHQQKAADSTKDGTINSADLMRIVKYLKGTANISL